MNAITKKKLIERVKNSTLPVKKTGEDFESSDLKGIISVNGSEVTDFPFSWYNQAEAIRYVRQANGKFFVID
jgi:hypothetical protein